MRGLAIATLFLGFCLIDPGADIPARAVLCLVRGLVFFVALVVIWFGI